MEKRQRYVEIRRIFNEVIEDEVRRYLKDPSKSKIDYYNVYGDMIFCDYQYEMVGDHDGANEVIRQIDGTNATQQAPTFVIHHDDNYIFWLHLEHPDINHNDRSYFCKYDRTDQDKYIYRLYGEDIMENDEFKKYILQMIQDIAPERIEEVQKLLA